nr:putative 1-phosphatidylinositol-3-phosphate 5-kinase FAB1C [Ipomoea batatas]
MGIPDSSLPDLIGKVKSWRGISDPTYLSGGLGMDSNRTCCECKMKFTESCLKYHCQICNRAFCGDCLQGNKSLDVVASGGMESTKEADIGIISCKFCSDLSTWHRSERKYSDVIHPSDSPRQSPEPPSPNYSSDRFDGYSPNAAKSSFASFSSNPSSVFVHRSPSRSDDDEGEDSTNEFLCPSSDCCHDTSSDIDSSSISARHELHSFKSVGSSPNDSPSRIHFTSNRVGHSVQQEQMETHRSLNYSSFDQETLNVLRRVDKGTEDIETTNDFGNNLSLYQSQFENNGLIWFPPPPEDEYDETENNFFTYDDEDDEVGESAAAFSSSGSLANTFLLKEKQNGGHKEAIRDVVQGHFRALVSQLLEAEGVMSGKEGSAEEWLDIVTTIAWQAASFVKPDTSRGGSMDPVNYVKVKCVASGRPCDSTFIRGIVCTKNIKHKRMTSHYKNARLLLLGGALEYQRVPNQLASFNTLLQQERDHLKTIVSKIEAHNPNVLLVEKSVSSYAQEQLLAKEISLVLNVKRPLLERIARCTGASITPSIDSITAARLGHCELFYLERVSEEHEATNQLNKKPSRTLMFFDGCPRRLGCTVLLKGCCREDLKKVKMVVQYAVFAAYHLSLETSFLTDEGASLPKMAIPHSIATQKIAERESATLSLEVGVPESLSQHHRSCSEDGVSDVPPTTMYNGNLASSVSVDDLTSGEFIESRCHERDRSQDTSCQEDGEPGEISERPTAERVNGIEASTDYYSAGDSQQSILVSFSSRCVLNDTLCERSRLLRIQFYGFFDKPLGRYLQDDLFSRASCRSCKEPTEAHVICYIHQHGNLTINVRRIPSVKLPGEKDNKIWMWHRCLRCAQVEGVPPATRRVLMSDAAWGLSFGKFLELSFSNHATANRVASCGHSLQRDCLRYYGSGSMVAIFRYSPINILSVRLPPSILEFNSKAEQAWTRREAAELLSKAKSFYGEIASAFNRIEEKSSSIGCELYDTSELQNYMLDLKDLLMKEQEDYNVLLQPTDEGISDKEWEAIDILEINRMRHSLIVASHVWDRRLYSMDSLLNKSSGSPTLEQATSTNLERWRSDVSLKNGIIEQVPEENTLELSKLEECHEKPPVSKDGPDRREDSMTSCQDEKCQESEILVENADKSPSEFASCSAAVLSDKIDSAWTGIDQSQKTQLRASLQDVPETVPSRQLSQIEHFSVRKFRSPARVHSFDSAMRLHERIGKGLPPSSLYLSTLRSFHASGDYRNMIRDPVSTVHRTCSQLLPGEAQKLYPLQSSSTAFISHASLLPEGARLMVPQNGQNDVVIAIYDNELTSIISYALSSREYKDWINDKPSVSSEGGLSFGDANRENSLVSKFSTWQPFGSLDLDYIHQVSYGSEDTSSTISSFFSDPKSSPHLRISFGDESPNAGGKVKFSVTCYFAKQFDTLRKKCCPNELDFIRSLSRCRRWSAQGGKSNVYFAKSFDERFIIKQIQKTELDSFEEFGPEYFKYLTDSLNSGSPTCLAKVLGIFQVTVKYLKGGKDTKMDLIVMENLFYGRNISRVYDLKGSVRSRYNSDTKANKVLLDLNLLETLQTKPIFLGSKAKKCLERAVWNDTSFLASVDVMDYSLLVGVDEERKELVLGIIDFMRQYTWDKHLETWVKASGILGGPKNASPTVVSPKQYKKRFRKAMTTYFLTVPDQWSS